MQRDSNRMTEVECKRWRKGGENGKEGLTKFSKNNYTNCSDKHIYNAF